MSEHVDIETLTKVEITVNDPDVIERVTGPEGDDWRASLYSLYTRDDVLAHLAYNAALNNVQRANQLDGWADMDDGAATMRVLDVDVQDIKVVA